MAWTDTDVADIKAAILKKAKGERLTTVDLGGRLESYADASLKDLKDLLAAMELEASTVRHPHILRSRYRKGL